jgi:hypothetical protein
MASPGGTRPAVAGQGDGAPTRSVPGGVPAPGQSIDVATPRVQSAVVRATRNRHAVRSTLRTGRAARDSRREAAHDTMDVTHVA